MMKCLVAGYRGYHADVLITQRERQRLPNPGVIRPASRTRLVRQSLGKQAVHPHGLA
jgi:hypothetical protein